VTIALKILSEILTVLVFNINVAKTYPRYLKYQSAVASKLSKIFRRYLPSQFFNRVAKVRGLSISAKFFLILRREIFAIF
jgi:hypothetical protein